METLPYLYIYISKLMYTCIYIYSSVYIYARSGPEPCPQLFAGTYAQTAIGGARDCVTCELPSAVTCQLRSAVPGELRSAVTCELQSVSGSNSTFHEAWLEAAEAARQSSHHLLALDAGVVSSPTATVTIAVLQRILSLAPEGAAAAIAGD